MIALGHVQNGVVVLDDNVVLPEGQKVAVVGLASEGGETPSNFSRQNSVLDIPAVRLGSILVPLTADIDLLGEMLDGRP